MTTQTIYGYCPQCGTIGISRERRPNGNDKCVNGHTYPSAKALSQPNEPVAITPDFFQLDNGSDYWYECPDDAGILDDLNDVEVGTEYSVFASHTYRQTYRVTKIPDEANDDVEVELVSSQRRYYTAPPNLEAKIAELEAKLALLEVAYKHVDGTDIEILKLQKQLAELTAKSEKMREVVDCANNLVKVKGRHHSEIAMNKLIKALEESK